MIFETDYSIDIAYLLRGKDDDWENCLNRFMRSYDQHRAGCKHKLHVIIKGFENKSDETRIRKHLSALECNVVHVDDDSFDLGAYRAWAEIVSANTICLLNTGSEILADCWLQKLYENFCDPSVGIVGATGSFESLGNSYDGFPHFPNPHIRSNAFMLQRHIYLEAAKGRLFQTKEDAFQFESGNTGLTRIIKKLGLKPYIVGRNGRAYCEKTWALSNTFRQGGQHNLLIGDGQTRGYASSPYHRKKGLTFAAWGTTCPLYR